jgi:hypothetical protein
MAAPGVEEGETGRSLVKPVRDREDLLRAARSVAEHFSAERVIIVGSQAILLTWPDAPVVMKITPEIDIYPENNRDWEARNPGFEASEEISVLFGEMSQFHQRFGFYLDGVDENTARMPPDWMDHSETMEIDVYGRTAIVVCPSIEDVIVSKLHRLVEKDVSFIKACAAARPMDRARILQRFRATGPDQLLIDRAESLFAPLDP